MNYSAKLLILFRLWKTKTRCPETGKLKRVITLKQAKELLKQDRK